MCSLVIYNTVYANYIIILSRRGTGIDGVSLCWVPKGVLGKRLSLGGAGIAKAVARHCWLVAAGSVGKELYQRHGGVGCLNKVRNNQQSAHFHARGFTLFPLAALEMGTDELKRLSLMQPESV